MFKQVPPIDDGSVTVPDIATTEAKPTSSDVTKNARFKFVETKTNERACNDPIVDPSNSCHQKPKTATLEPCPPTRQPPTPPRQLKSQQGKQSAAQRALIKAEEEKTAALEQHLQEHKQLQGHHGQAANSSRRASMASKIKERKSFTAPVVPDPTPKAQQELNIKKLFTVFADLKTGLVNRDEFVLAVQETGLMIDKDPRLKSLSAMKQTGPANLDLGTFSQFVIYWSRMT